MKIALIIIAALLIGFYIGAHSKLSVDITVVNKSN